MDIKAKKRAQRQTVLARRDAIPNTVRKEKSLAICENILKSDFYKRASRIMLFRAFRSEVDLSCFEAIARANDKTLLYPRCLEAHEMCALSPLSDSAWEKDAYGINVPRLDASIESPPEAIDLILCPCSAFDESFHRLGMGAGYYDRYLPKCKNAKIVLIAFEEQCLDAVCVDEHDVLMHGIITDKRVLLNNPK